MLFADLEEALNEVGVDKGDLLYVGSDVTRLLNEVQHSCDVRTSVQRDAFLSRLVDTFQNVVGQSGTLLFPVFTWDFCRGKGFDILSSRGEVGALNNWVLARRPDFRRTQHPMYSFMVWGRATEELISLDNIGAWDNESPFHYLHCHAGKMLCFDVSVQRAFTFMHYVENALRVPYRYEKKFSGIYRDVNGLDTQRNYTMYVRDLSIISHEYLPDDFIDNSVAGRYKSWNGHQLRYIDLAKAYELLRNDFLNNGGHNCYYFENYELDWSKGQTHADELNN